MKKISCISLLLALCLLTGMPAQAQSIRSMRYHIAPPEGDDLQPPATPTLTPAPTPTPTPAPTPVDEWLQMLNQPGAQQLITDIAENYVKLETLRTQVNDEHSKALNRLSTLRRGSVSNEVLTQVQADLRDIRALNSQLLESNEELTAAQGNLIRCEARRDQPNWANTMREIKRIQELLLDRYARAIQLVEQVVAAT